MPIPMLLVLMGASAQASPEPGLDLSAPAQQARPAQPALQDQPAEPVAAPVASHGTRGRRTYLMQINARARYLSVPSSILDISFFDSDDEGANPYDRPKVRGWAFGGEYVFDVEPGNYVLYAEYIKPTMKEGYWDDVEAPTDHNDGDWIRPDGLGAFVVGATYMHELDAIPTGPGESDVGLSFLFGAGLGLMVVNGGLEVWHPGSNPDNLDSTCLPNSPAYERVDQCGSDGYKRIPKVLPMVDLSASARVNFADHFHIRIDGGLHDVLSLGSALGVVF